MGVMRLRLVLLLVVGCTVLGLPGVAAAADGCPNEALRTEQGSGALPDCRAWEMVTPGFKDSQTGGSLEQMSNDGSSVLVNSSGVFGGAKSVVGVLENRYLMTRSPSGWITSAIEPPASQFPAQLFLGASSDLTRTLWALHSPSQPFSAWEVYVREEDGSLRDVGPVSQVTGPAVGDPYVLLDTGNVSRFGISNDASHVLFTLFMSQPGGLWPGDTTQIPNAPSLYEYVGFGHNRPALVGVDAEDHLLGDCGMAAGSFESGDTAGALSTSGETVFFTVYGAGTFACTEAAPPVNELYARLGQFPIDTVAISEPAYSDCTRCQTDVEGIGHPAVPLAKAEFQGASEDGSKVVFLTEQELFAGDTGMNLYEYDFDNPAGQKIVRISMGSSEPEVKGVARVSADGSHVYFVAGGVLSGANAEGIAPALHGDNLYVFERDAEYPGGRVAFIGTLSEGDEGTVFGGGDWSLKDQRPVQATADGRFLVFQSVADLTPGDTSSQPQIFEYDAQTESLVRVSIAAAGYAAGATSGDAVGSSISSINFTEHAYPTAGRAGVAVSADGSVVLFSSRAALVPSAMQATANGAASVYEYHSSGFIKNGSVSLLSSGRDTASATGVGLTASGGDAFFVTSIPLLAQDVDTSFDLYDARVGGGFPAPLMSGCEGEACQGAEVSAPSSAGPGSVFGVGGGNLVSPPPVSPPLAGEAIPRPKGKVLTRAQKLAAALRVCRRGSPRRRVVCEARAHRRFGVSTGRGKGR